MCVCVRINRDSFIHFFFHHLNVKCQIYPLTHTHRQTDIKVFGSRIIWHFKADDDDDDTIKLLSHISCSKFKDHFGTILFFRLFFCCMFRLETIKLFSFHFISMLNEKNKNYCSTHTHTQTDRHIICEYRNKKMKSLNFFFY